MDDYDDPYEYPMTTYARVLRRARAGRLLRHPGCQDPDHPGCPACDEDHDGEGQP